MKHLTCKHMFVECIPEQLEEGMLYVSIPYATAVHKCFCGCGREVVTPLSPADWQLMFDGKTVSLHPSIGSWNLSCKSHYWIRRNKVEWARRWSRREIELNRTQDRLATERYFESGQTERPRRETGPGPERGPSGHVDEFR